MQCSKTFDKMGLIAIPRKLSHLRAVDKVSFTLGIETI